MTSTLAGIGQEVFHAGVLALVIVMLAWHNIWMAQHGRELASEARGIGNAVRQGQRSLAALAIVVGVAVLREGFEVALFLHGLAILGDTATWDVLAGSAGGLLLGGILSVLPYLGLMNIPLSIFPGSRAC